MLFKTLYFLRQRLDPAGSSRSQGVRIGQRCRLINVDFGSEPWLITLGNHVSATNVSFVTHDGGVWVFREQFPDLDCLAPIVVGDNVFLGSRCIVLPGVTIGNNVVVGAGAIVSEDIPPNCVAAGVPARPIRSLEEYRERILRRSEPTKRMSGRAKREHYLKKYSLR